MANTVKKLDSKLQNSSKAGLKSQTRQEIQGRGKAGKLRQRSSNVRASTFWVTIG